MKKIIELDLVYLLKKAKDFEITKSSILQNSDWTSELKTFFNSLDKTFLPERFAKNNNDSFENMLSLISHFEKNKIFELYETCEQDSLPTINNTLKMIGGSNSFKKYLKTSSPLSELIHYSAIEGNNLVLSKGLNSLNYNSILDDSFKQEIINKALYSAILNHQNGNNLGTIKLCFFVGGKLPDFKNTDTALNKDIFESILYSKNKDLINLLIEKIGKENFDSGYNKTILNLEDMAFHNEIETFMRGFNEENQLASLVKNFENKGKEYIAIIDKDHSKEQEVNKRVGKNR
jgi:hypothetical protein